MKLAQSAVRTDGAKGVALKKSGAPVDKAPPGAAMVQPVVKQKGLAMKIAISTILPSLLGAAGAMAATMVPGYYLALCGGALPGIGG